MSLYRIIFIIFTTIVSRSGAGRTARREMERIRNVAAGIAPDRWRRPVRIPPMPGLAESMLDWSAGMVLWHTAVVSRGIQTIVTRLAAGEDPEPVDFKACDLPPPDAGPEQLPPLEAATGEYLRALETMPGFRTRRRFAHPIFGKINAHGWHCMFALHLTIHRKQLEAIAVRLSGEERPS